MSTDDRFLPQGKQILPKICQVRPMPKSGAAKKYVGYKRKIYLTFHMWNELTILWNDLTIDWNDLTWNDVNDLTMERNDRLPSCP